MKHGVEEQQWLTYRIVIASGAGVLVGAGGCLALLLPHPCFCLRVLRPAGLVAPALLPSEMVFRMLREGGCCIHAGAELRWVLRLHAKTLACAGAWRAA